MLLYEAGASNQYGLPICIAVAILLEVEMLVGVVDNSKCHMCALLLLSLVLLQLMLMFYRYYLSVASCQVGTLQLNLLLAAIKSRLFTGGAASRAQRPGFGIYPKAGTCQVLYSCQQCWLYVTAVICSHMGGNLLWSSTSLLALVHIIKHVIPQCVELKSTKSLIGGQAAWAVVAHACILGITL